MATWDVTPKEVKGPDRTAALKAAHAQLAVKKRAPAPPPTPSFLDGLTKRWSDDCSSPDLLARWTRVTAQRLDGQQASSTSLASLAPGRITQVPGAGIGGKDARQFHCEPTDTVWTPGTAGRSEANLLSPMFHEGERWVTMVDMRPDFDVDRGGGPNDWRVLFQMKQDESLNWAVAPMLTLECRGGAWVLVNYWHDRWDCAAKRGIWTRWAFDVTYSADPSKGRVQVHADLDGDGTYEEVSPLMTMQTLLAQQSGVGPGIPSDVRTGIYEGIGGDTVQQADYQVWG